MFWILTALALLSVLLNLWQWLAAQQFRFDRRPADFAPAISVLRPLKDGDAETEACLESWFRQNYSGHYELLFGVASPNDPACAVVQRLLRRFPHVPAELVICHPILGPNAKVSTICHLTHRAKYDHLVISDQDVFVPEDFLAQFIQPLKSSTVGLVNCFYILAEPRGVGMWLEAVAVNADFWSQVLQGNMLKRMDFALGAAIATTKSHLRKIGGLETILDYLADDYELGNRIAQHGVRLEISSIPVECRSEPQAAAQVWNHQLRWARTIRVCRPFSYFFSILSNATLWPLLLAVVYPLPGGWILGGALLFRGFTAASNYRRLTNQSGWRAGLLAPIKDLLQIAIWVCAFAGNEVRWRDRRFRVNRCGKLTPLA